MGSGFRKIGTLSPYLVLKVDSSTHVPDGMPHFRNAIQGWGLEPLEPGGLGANGACQHDTARQALLRQSLQHG